MRLISNSTRRFRTATPSAAALVLVLASGAFAASPAPAAAAAATKGAPAGGDKSRAKELYLAAEKEFGATKYDAALALYGEAYKAFPEPIFLFNIAQCHRLAGRFDQALFFYREYLRTKPDAPNRADVEALIRDLEASAPPLLPTAASGAAVKDGAEPKHGDGAIAVPTPEPSALPPASPRGAGLSAPGLTLAAGGAAALGVSIFTGLVTQHANARLKAAGRDTEADFVEALELEHRARLYGATTAVLVAAGGTLLAAGVVVVVLRLASPRRDGPAVTAEIVGGPGLGLGLRGTFGLPLP
jgi:tetratricopeptide (TPR) repeat protein